MEKVSKYITLAEATKSQAAIRNGIKNVPGPKELAAMKLVGEKVFDKVREHFGIPLTVSSFYRCPALNKAVKGSATSQHVKGEAIDIDADGSPISNKQVFEYIKANLDFDQLLWEFGDSHNPAWVHVSYKPSGNRKQVLVIK